MTEHKELTPWGYAKKIEEFFERRGLVPLLRGSLFVELSDKGWTSACKWDKSTVGFIADFASLAIALAQIELRSHDDSGDMTGSVRLGFGMGSSLPLLIPKNMLEDARPRLLAIAKNRVSSSSNADLTAFIETGTPADLARHDSRAAECWLEWLKTASVNEKLALAKSTRDGFSALALDDGICPSQGHVMDNATELCANLGCPHLAPMLSRVLSMLVGIWGGIGDIGSLAYDRARDDDFNGCGGFFDILDMTFGPDATAIFEPGNPLTKASICRSLNRSDQPPYKKHEWQGLSSFAEWYLPTSKLHLLTANIPSGKLSSLFAKPLTHGAVGLESFGHLQGETLDCMETIKAGPCDILLWGPPGAGKTSLAKALAAKSGLMAVGVPVEDDSTDNNTDQGQARLLAVASAQALAPAAGAGMLIIDEAEEILRGLKHKHLLTESLETKLFPRIWIINETKDIHEAFLRRFDLIVKVPEMPVEYRELLARTLFNDSELALKVARSMRTPHEIEQAARWRDPGSDGDWTSIARRSEALRAAVAASKAETGNSGAIVVRRPGDSKIKFGGYPSILSAGERLTRIFKDPLAFSKLGAKPPKGVMLFGAPGTGKTLFALHLSEKSGVPLVVCDGASLARNPELISQAFSEARKASPCVMFIDEIDAIAASVDLPNGTLSLERQGILNKLLVEMDGMDKLDGVVVIGATHRSSSLDDAVLRSGRFGMSLFFPMPTIGDRKGVWEACLDGAPLESDISFDGLSASTSGFSCADIAEAANLGRVEAALRGAASISQTDLLKACDDVFWGAMTPTPMTPHELRRVALHESGHALVALEAGLELARLTIRPRAGFLGALQWSREEGLHAISGADSLWRAAVCAGGMVAEKVALGTGPNSGWQSDLLQAKDLIWRSLRDYAQSDFGPVADEPHQPMSPGLRERLEADASETLLKAIELASVILGQRGEALTALADELLFKRELNMVELREFLQGLNLTPIQHHFPIKAPLATSSYHAGVLHVDKG